MRCEGVFHKEIGHTTPVLIKMLEHKNLGVLSSIIYLLGTLKKQGEW
jgi:hypothetical protein